MPNGKNHMVEFWGDFACITRPEMKVERYSYPCLTPSAARGALEAIYFKPQFYWQVDKVELLNAPNYLALRRNEIKDKASEAMIKKWIKGTAEPEPLFADASGGEKGRTQRQTMALRNPRFRVTARIIPRRGNERQQKAYDQQFARRARQGKCFQQPYLGCREFVAFFRYVESLEDEPSPCAYNQDLGWMLYDVFDLNTDNYVEPENRKKNWWKNIGAHVALFHAQVVDGVLVVPPYDSDDVRKPSLTGKGAD